MFKIYSAKLDTANNVLEAYRQNSVTLGTGEERIEKWVQDNPGEEFGKGTGRWEKLKGEDLKNYLAEKKDHMTFKPKKSLVGLKSLIGFGLGTSILGGAATYGLTMVPWATVATGIATAATTLAATSVGLLPALGVGLLAVGAAVGGAFAIKKVIDVIRNHDRVSLKSFWKAKADNSKRLDSKKLTEKEETYHKVDVEKEKAAKEQEKVAKEQFEKEFNATLEALKKAEKVEDLTEILAKLKDFKASIDAEHTTYAKTLIATIPEKLKAEIKDPNAFATKMDLGNRFIKKARDMVRESNPSFIRDAGKKLFAPFHHKKTPEQGPTMNNI